MSVSVIKLGVVRALEDSEACVIVLIEMCYAQTHLAREGYGILQSDWFNSFYDQNIGMSGLC